MLNLCGVAAVLVLLHGAATATASHPEEGCHVDRVGDGVCDYHANNLARCDWDGGDCCLLSGVAEGWYRVSKQNLVFAASPRSESINSRRLDSEESSAEARASLAACAARRRFSVAR